MLQNKRLMLQGKYTIELGAIIEDENFELFDFNYDFYDPDLKPIFEELFQQNYYFNEIGFETVGRFKKMLQSHLNINMPYWSQLYKTELASRDISFLLNKDLKETFVRELTQDNKENENLSANTNSKDTSNTYSDSNYKESSIENGIANVYDDNNITSTNENKNNISLNGEHTDINNSNRNKNENNKTYESTTLISQGNIGTTSSAELLIKWRECLINLNKIIIDSCSDLFMLVY